MTKIERFDGKDFLGVQITQNGKVTEVYLNLLADQRIKHRNSLNVMNGWDTDAYLTALTFPEGADRMNPKNIKQLFMAHGSYLRRDGQTLIHSLSKFFAVVDYDGNTRNIHFQGQPVVKFQLAADRKSDSVILNGVKQKTEYHPETKLMELNINTIR